MLIEGFKGFLTSKIGKKYLLRMVQNADIDLKEVIVPDIKYLKTAIALKFFLNLLIQKI